MARQVLDVGPCPLPTYRAQHDLGMAMVLAGSGSMQAVPQKERMLGFRVCLASAADPLMGDLQQLAELLLIELQWVMVLEQHQPMAGLTVLE